MFRLGLTLVLACLCVQAAFGQSPYVLRHQDWEVAGFVGGSFMAGKSEFPTTVSDSGQQTSRTVGMDYASGYQLGVRVAENLGNYWGADLEYSFANQPLRFTNLTPTVQSLSLGHSVHHFSYSISYIPFPRTKRFRAYGKLGTGASLFFIHGDSLTEALEQGIRLEDTWKLMINWGGGIKYLVADQFALTFDVKDHMTGVPSYGLPKSARIAGGQFFPGIDNKGILHSWQLNIGVGFQWDD